MTAKKKKEAKKPEPVADMGLPEETPETRKDLGDVHIRNSVIAVIARTAAMKVPGVAELTHTLAEGLAGMIGKKVVERGIAVDVQGNHVEIDLYAIMEYGVRIPHVAWQLQNDVREAVEQMTGKHVKSVNVMIQGVRMPGEGAGEGEEGVL